MRFGDPHTLMLYFVYAMLGLSGYFLIIYFFCMFLAFGEASDNIRPRSAHRTRQIAKVENQYPEADHQQVMDFMVLADPIPSPRSMKSTA
jgi:hypothetical protein